MASVGPEAASTVYPADSSPRVTMRRIAGSSSTTRIVSLPCDSDHGVDACSPAARSGEAALRGKKIANVEPRPTSLDTVMNPPL